MKNYFLALIFFTFFYPILQAKCASISVYSKLEITKKVIETDSVALDNAYMKVLRDGAGCTLANTPNFGTRIIVALDKIKFKSKRVRVKIKRGEIAVFLENESYDLPKGSYFEIALKKVHPPFLCKFVV